MASGGEIRLPSLDDVSFNVDTSKLMNTLKEIVRGVQSQSSVRRRESDNLHAHKYE